MELFTTSVLQTEKYICTIYFLLEEHTAFKPVSHCQQSKFHFCETGLYNLQVMATQLLTVSVWKLTSFSFASENGCLSGFGQKKKKMFYGEPEGKKIFLFSLIHFFSGTNAENNLKLTK